MLNRKRGRPKLNLVENDSGTKELQSKKKLGITTEILDILLKKQMISEAEHLACLHFRWLYTLKFGIKNLTCSYTDIHFDFSPTRQDEGWREKREAEYDRAWKLLETVDARKIIIAICIFNEAPAFLVLARENIKTNKELRQFQAGLELLANEWNLSAPAPIKKFKR